MADRIDFTLVSNDGVSLSCYEWPCAQARAAVVIVHGMAEHAARYGRFAEALNDTGIAALAMDLRGHGASIQGGAKGWFAEKDGWKAVLEDFRQLCLAARERYPSAPLVLFGHSMGSIFARAALFTYGELFHAAVLSGVTVDQPGRRDVAPAIACVLGALQGRRNPSKLLDSLTFGSYNKRFRPNRTAFDWLSRDEREVDKYVADENCGFICTGAMFVDVSHVLLETLKRGNIEKMPKSVPVFIISGAEDPVGMFGGAAGWLAARYRSAGLDVSMKVYDQARHELLNEVNRQEVTADIVEFIEKCLDMSRAAG